MENNNNGGQESQPGAVKPIWDVITSQTDAVINTTTPPATTPEQIQTEDTTTPAATEPVVEPAKTETVKEEVKPDAKTETNPDGTPKAEPAKTEPAKADELEPPKLELTVADIKDAPTQFEDGTFQSLADDMGFSIAEENPDLFFKTFKENFVPKSEVDKIIIDNKEKLYSTLDPKIATAFNLIDMGVPPELALNPTKVQDEYLAMDNAQLVREALAAQQGWNEEMVDAQMEEISADPQKLKIKADIVRANLNTEKQQILQEQTQLVQKYTEQKQQVALQQKAEADNQFKQALANEQAFMGLNLSKEVKDAILSKYNKGLYESVLNPAQAKLRAILQLEYGDKFAKAVQSKAKEEGKAEIVRKLSDVPPKVTPGAGARQQTVVADNNQENKGVFGNIPIFQ